MLKNFELLKAELMIEVNYAQPMFNIFDTSSLVATVFKRLEKYGLKLSDLRAEHTAVIGERHLHCYLFNYVMTVKIRFDKIEITCTDFPQSQVNNFASAIQDVLEAVKESSQQISYKTLGVALACHGRIEEQAAWNFLKKMPAQIPSGLGPPTGGAIAFYFGQENDRLFSSITLDMSTIIRDALFLRIQATWDGSRVAAEFLEKMTKEYFVQALGSIGLQHKT